MRTIHDHTLLLEKSAKTPTMVVTPPFIVYGVTFGTNSEFKLRGVFSELVRTPSGHVSRPPQIPTRAAGSPSTIDPSVDVLDVH